jgi:ribA/ribD-fused uncharacterized protein
MALDPIGRTFSTQPLFVQKQSPAQMEPQSLCDLITSIFNQIITFIKSLFGSISLADRVKGIAQSGLVCFYKSGPTELFGNFALCPNGVCVFGQRFRCSEAAFQWRKFDIAARESFQIDPQLNRFFTANGEEAFQLRNQYMQKYSSPRNWENGLKDEVMWTVLKAKFNQNPTFEEVLQATRGAYLLEHCPRSRDNYWSDNHDGSGRNRLGDLLMTLRDKGPFVRPIYHPANHRRLREYAQLANQPGALNYPIF